MCTGARGWCKWYNTVHHNNTEQYLGYVYRYVIGSNVLGPRLSNTHSYGMECQGVYSSWKAEARCVVFPSSSCVHIQHHITGCTRYQVSKSRNRHSYLGMGICVIGLRKEDMQLQS